jgi:cobalamin biosynthesis Mg chelatase CobN
MWQETFDVYVKDKHNLDLKRFFDEKSPFAYQDMTARMIETVRKEHWHPDGETLQTLLTEYIESVKEHGVGCSDNTCGNPRLLDYVVKQALENGVPAPDVQQFAAAMEKALGAPIAGLAEAARQFAAANDARVAARQAPGAEAVPGVQNVDEAELKGYLMQNVNPPQPNAADAVDIPPDDGEGDWSSLWAAVGVLAVLLAWRWRHGRMRK